MDELIARKAEERTAKAPRTQVVGWTEEELDQLGEKFTAIEPALLHLQRHEGVRIRSAGTSAKRATVGILDTAGQWIPRDASTREWPTAVAALQSAGFTVDEDGEILAYVAPAEEAAPAKSRRDRAATKG